MIGHMASIVTGSASAVERYRGEETTHQAPKCVRLSANANGPLPKLPTSNLPKPSQEHAEIRACARREDSHGRGAGAGAVSHMSGNAQHPGRDTGTAVVYGLTVCSLPKMLPKSGPMSPPLRNMWNGQ